MMRATGLLVSSLWISAVQGQWSQWIPTVQNQWSQWIPGVQGQLSQWIPAVQGRSCKFIPGDEGWPSNEDWAALNASVDGRLIATRPLASVCHKTGPFAAYNKAACEKLRDGFEKAGAQTLLPIPGEVFNPYWENQTCSPFTSPEAPCELGHRAVYSIKVSGAADVQAGLKFAAEKNVRLVIKNTGIDYMGQSTGQGALALWTYQLKSREVIKNFKSASWTGPALKLGSGVTGGEAQELARDHGYRLVGPECGLAGIAGGYVQSGGQSQLVTAYGLSVDQVLEWEVVTPQGEHLVATPEEHADLYWALAGGGGGTYGVVLSVTFRVFPEGPVAGGFMNAQTKNETALWEAISLWYSQGPALMAKSRDNIQFFATKETLTVLNFVLPDQKDTEIKKLLSNFLPHLDRLNIPYNLTTDNYPTFMDSFVASYGELPWGTLCPSFPIISSRLIPRATVLDPESNKKLMNVYRNVVNDGTWWIGCSMLNVDDAPGSVRPAHPPNSVHPAWRKAIAYCNPQTHEPYDWENPRTNDVLRQKLVNDIYPAIEAATPGSGGLNELDPTYKGDWKQTLYGSNYKRLLKIKQTYDPDHLLYGKWAVGSEPFSLDGEGRLCKN